MKARFGEPHQRSWTNATVAPASAHPAVATAPTRALIRRATIPVRRGPEGVHGPPVGSPVVVATSRAPSRTTFPYLEPLDGLRGILVFPVVLYHFSITGGTGTILAPGSYLAPSTFFALSGFLITSLLLVERERTGTIDGRGFWTRRFRRLIPASVTVVLVCVVISAIWPHVWA